MIMRKKVKPAWVFAVTLAVTIPAMALLKTTVFSNNKNTISSDNTTKYDIVADLGDGGKFESGEFSKMPDGKWIYKYTPSKNPTPIPKPVKEGYIFEGWLVDGNQTPKLNYTIPAWNRKNINLIAKWSASASVLLPGSQFNKYIHDNLSLSRLNDMKFVKGKPDLTGLDWVDVSQSQNESIIAYMDDHVLTVASDSDIIANEDCSFMFNNFYQIYTLKLDNFDTSNVTNMSNMFNYCVNLIELDVSKFNTNNVTDMSGMFDTCYNLTSLDLNNFNTRNVISMKRMFRECCNLVSLDLSKFNTSNVTDMSEMFYCTFCKTKASLNVSTFNTGKVKTMESMFGLCGQLDELDLSSFDTKNVATMYKMFTECYNLKTIKFGNFNFSNLKNTSGMFLGCEKLSGELTITDANVDNYEGMFQGCSSDYNAKFIVKYKDAQTKELARKMVNTKNPNDHVYLYGVNASTLMKGSDFNSIFGDRMYDNITAIEFIEGTPNPNGIDCSLNLDKSIMAEVSGTTLKVVCDGEILANPDSFRMFYGLADGQAGKKLNSIKFDNFNTKNVTDMSSMFWYCSNLKTLDLSNWNTSKVTNMNQMFWHCGSLVSVKIDSWDTSNVTHMSGMFESCYALGVNDFSPLKFDNVINTQYMFMHCANLDTTICINNDNIWQSIMDTFSNTSKSSGKVIVNYAPGCKYQAQQLVNTKSASSNVLLGQEIISLKSTIKNRLIRSIIPTNKPVNLTLNNGPSAQYPKQVVTVRNNRIPNLTAPELNPKYAGQFGGYYYDEQCTKPVKQGDIVTKDLTIYARW